MGLSRMATRLVAPAEGIPAAAALLASGDVVALPTETVYGLGAAALDPAACAKIFEAKERPLSDPLIVHLPGIDWLERLAEASAAARELASRFWPGPLTLVLPRRYPVGRLALPGSRRYQPGGVALASRIGESPEFIGLRDYRPGDPLRRIDWKSWAKEGKPIVREYRDEQFVRHALVLDTFAAPGREEHFEEAVSVAASFAATVLTQESLLDLLFVVDKAYCVTAGRGVGSAARMLEVLAGVERCAAQSFSVLSVSVLRRAATLTGCLLVLTDYDASRREMLESLQALGIPVRAFVICDSTTQAESSWGPSVRRIEIGRAAEGLALP